MVLFTLCIDKLHPAFRQIDILNYVRICVFKKLLRLLFLRFACIDYKPHSFLTATIVYISVSPGKISIPGLSVVVKCITALKNQ